MPLLADPDLAILARLGALKEGGGVKRMTFVIDKSGIIRYAYDNVSVRDHADIVLAAVKTL